jgi:hypothetical protein
VLQALAPACGDEVRREYSRATMMPLIDWQAPAECPDAAAVTQRLQAAREAQPAAWESAVRVRGRVRRDASSEWVLELAIERGLHAGPAHRRLSAPHCDELADAAAVAITLALGAGGSSEPGAQHPATSEPAPAFTGQGAAAAAEPPDRGPLQGDSEPPPPWALSLAAEAVLDSGLLAGVGWGVAAGVQLQRGAWNGGLYGLWLPERAEQLARGQGVDFHWLATGLRGCRQARAATLLLSGCVGLELGWLRAAGYGLSGAAGSSATLLAPTLSAGLRWPVERWAFTSRLEGVLPLPRQEYTVDAGERIHETPALVLRWTLGLATDLFGS